MTLDKAIELNKESEKSLRSNKYIDHADAILLGNEAIKLFERMRNNPTLSFCPTLPGETKD